MQYNSIKSEIDQAVLRVLKSGWYILGNEVKSLEQSFARYCGVRYAVGVASGTDAISLALRACGVGWADEVVTVPNTAVATAVAISLAGAQPVFVDIDPYTYNMDVGQLEKFLKRYFARRKSKDVTLKAIVPVHLFGQPCDMKPIMDLARRYGLSVIEDASQAHGAEYSGKKVGIFGDVSGFSFYPSKNMGAYGDGGIVVTDSKKIYEQLLMLRNYGQTKRYHHKTIGLNSRLDEIQAAILQIKLKYLDKWNQRRRQIAEMYNSLLDNNVCIKPCEKENVRHIYHLYVIRCKRRSQLQQYLGERGIQTAIHYPVPIHLQKAYRHLRFKKGDFPIAEKYASQILSLPVYPELKDGQIEYIARNINKFYNHKNK